MKIKINLFIAFLLMFSVITFRAQAQDTEPKYEVKGKITDDVTGEPLIGASVTYAPGKGVQTDADGNFVLMLPNGRYDLKITYVGYQPMAQKVTVAGQNKTVDPVPLQSANNLEEVEVAADVARTRETPIAFSDIDSKQIAEEQGANDITMLLNSTPGAYASQQGGGAGDSRINIRGFDQKNIAVLIDGVPVNDMESGQVYWSNWAGLSEITKKMQVQRGLGASRLALPSVGGVMNIITKTVENEQFFTVREVLGTNNFQRFSAAYNSGLIKNKFGVTVAGSYVTGDGYIDQTWQKMWSYFAKASYKVNSNNLLVLSVSGAPQSHGQRSYAINPAYHDKAFAQKQGVNTDSIYALPYSGNAYTTTKIGARGITYSPDWGYVNGKPFATKINYFNKPMANLSYFLTINPRTSFSNVLYYSNGTGGGTTLSSFPQYDKTGTGQLNLQGYYDVNSTTKTGTLVPGQRESSFYQYSKINNHDWVGTLSTFKYRSSSRLEFLGGFDARYYVGTHYETPYNMLGGDYIMTNADANLNPSDPHNLVKHIGDKFGYYYRSKIGWLGLFGQGEYKSKRITAFATVTGNGTSFQIVNYFAKKDVVLSDNNIVPKAVGYGDTLYVNGNTNAVKAAGFPATKSSDGSVTFRDVTGKTVTIAPGFTTYNNNSPQARYNTSKARTYGGYTVKGGFNYKLNQNHNVFVNLGHMSITPRFTNIYDQSGASVGNISNQLIFTGELGYTIKYRRLALNLNGYMTRWGNKPLDFPIQSLVVDPVTQSPIYYNVPGVNALLKGLEFDLTYKPIRHIEARVFGTVADWKWTSGGKAYAFTQSGVAKDSINFDATGVHIGNAPQRQLGVNVRLELPNGFYVKPQYTYFSKMYAQFDPTKLIYDGKNDYRRMDSWRMPGFGLFDLYLGYRLQARRTQVDITAVMNNVLNTVYMTDASFSTTPNNYNATYAYGWMGLGRRITMSVKLTFK